MIVPRIEDRRPLATFLIGLIVLCWVALIVWGNSPYGRYLSHEAIGDLGGGVGLPYAGFALVFVAAWVLMTGAMMLPTTLPLVLLFGRFTGRRRDAAILTPLLLSGYLLIWALFGATAHLGDLGIHAAVARSHWLQDHTWLLTAGVFLTAGVYQFTPLKQYCIKQCQSPYAFIVAHWHGQEPKRDAFWLGLHHGLFCIGCCWSLMLVMFGVGMGNLAWMLVLGAVMAIEKNLPWGRRLSTPLGVLLLAVAMALVLANGGLTAACAHDGGACSGS
jgi:predicted metal-binding membrane protein